MMEETMFEIGGRAFTQKQVAGVGIVLIGLLVIVALGLGAI